MPEITLVQQSPLQGNVLDLNEHGSDIEAIVEQALTNFSLQQGNLPSTKEEALQALAHHRQILVNCVQQLELAFITLKPMSKLKFNALVRNLAMHIKSIEKLVTFLSNQQVDVQIRDSETNAKDLIVHIYYEIADARVGLFPKQVKCYSCGTVISTGNKKGMVMVHTGKAEERSFFGGHSCPAPKDSVANPSDSSCLTCTSCGEANCIYYCTYTESYEAIRKNT